MNTTEQTEYLKDRLVDIMLDESIGGRTPPDLSEAITRAVVQRRRLEHLPITLAIAASIAALLAYFAPRLFTSPAQQSPSDLTQHTPHPLPPTLESGGPPPHRGAGFQPVLPPPPRGAGFQPALPPEYLTEAKRWPPPVAKAVPETPSAVAALSKARWKELDAREAHNLTRAAHQFTGKSYRAAVAAFDNFIMEFPRSKAVPYALLLKGRALQLDEKRFRAINVYEEVLDYFPNAIEFAAPALFYIGQCHLANGDSKKATKAWREMTTDKDYSKHRFAAYAMNFLADQLWRQAKLDKALEYYRHVVRDFRDTMPDAGLHAVLQVARYHILVEPNEPRLREWYREAGTFGLHRVELAGNVDLSKDTAYWSTVINLVNEHARSFPDARAHMRRQAMEYWLAIFDSYMPGEDKLLVARADVRRRHTGDGAAWVKEMDAIFAAGYRPGDTDRVLRWISYYSKMPDQAARYCAMVDPDAENIAALGTDGKAALAVELGRYNADTATRIIEQIPDQGRRLKALVDYYASLGPNAGEQGFPLHLDADDLPRERLRVAEKLAKIEKHAAHARWATARFLHWDKQYRAAIAAYRACDNPPDNLWPIVECYTELGDWDHAIEELVQIEHFCSGLGPKAALMQAEIYARAGQRDRRIATLRRIMKKYRAAKAAGTAHGLLEQLGVPIGGGLDADEEKRKEQ